MLSECLFPVSFTNHVWKLFSLTDFLQIVLYFVIVLYLKQHPEGPVLWLLPMMKLLRSGYYFKLLRHFRFITHFTIFIRNLHQVLSDPHNFPDALCKLNSVFFGHTHNWSQEIKRVYWNWLEKGPQPDKSFSAWHWWSLYGQCVLSWTRQSW